MIKKLSTLKEKIEQTKADAQKAEAERASEVESNTPQVKAKVAKKNTKHNE